MLWILTLVTIYNNGNITIEIQYPQDLTYNTEEYCNANGQTTADDMLTKLGVTNGRVVYNCQPINLDTIK